MGFTRSKALARYLLAPLLVAAWRAPAVAAGCSVAGQEVTLGVHDDVVVRPPGGDPFQVRVYELPVSATITAKRGARTHVDVKGAIAFTATVRTLWYQISRELETADGMVKLQPGALVADARAGGDAVVASVVMATDSSLPGEPAETAAPVRLPCDALSLDVSAKDAEGQVSGDGTWWQARGRPARIRLHARPAAKAAAIVVAAHHQTDGRLAFERLEVRGDWMRVARRGHNVVVSGWTPATALAPIPRDPGSSGYGHSPGPGLHGRGRRAKPYLYEGPARIAVGTTVFADHGRGAWARVTGEDGFRIRYDEGSAWAEITEIPGIVGPDVRAYVRVAATKQVR